MFKDCEGVMKKVLFIVICTLFMLFGCSKTNTKSQLQEFTYILFVAPLENHPIWQKSAKGLFDACNEEGYYCDWIGPATIDTAAMNDTMERGIIAKADAIITQGVIDEQLVKQAKENNIPVVLVDNDMPASARTAFFGKNFTQQAELLLADIEKRMGEDEPIIMAIQVAEESFPIAAQQIEEIEKVFLKHRGGFEIVDVTSSKSDKVRARKEWVSTFEKYENVNVSISLASESVESCYESAKELHKSDNMLIYGVDDLQPTIQLLKKGRITGSIITLFYDYGYKTVKYLKSYWENEDNSKKERFDVDIQMLTKEEAKDYPYEK